MFCLPQIFVLSKKGVVYVWDESRPSSAGLVQCVYTVTRELIVTDIAVSKTNLLLVTDEGLCFEAVHKPRKEAASASAHHQQETGGGNKAKAVKSFNRFDRSQCDVLKVRQRLPGIFRAVGCSIDPKGRNFCILQPSPSSDRWRPKAGFIFEQPNKIIFLLCGDPNAGFFVRFSRNLEFFS